MYYNFRQMKLKLKFGFLEIFILFVAIIFVVDLYVDYYEEINREKNTFNRYFEQIYTSISSEVGKIGGAVNEIVDISQQFYKINKLDFNDHKSLNAFFMPFMKKYPFITSINYGDEKGNGYLILNLGNIWKNRIKRASENGRVTWIELNGEGDEISRSSVADNYDPRLRPWYEIAKDNKSVNWSSPYIFRTTKDVGITASYNLSPVNSKKAVIGLDIMLKDLSEYLNHINVAYKDAVVSILSMDGKIVASSEEGFKDYLKKYEVDLLKVSESHDSLLYKAYRTFLEKKEQSFSIKINDENYFVSVKNCEFSSTDKLFIFITIPESTFFARYREISTKRTVFFFIILVIGGFFFAKRFLLPLKNLTNTILSFPSEDYHTQLYKDRNDEVGHLSKAFDKMAKEIEQQRRQLELSEKNYRLLFEANPLPFFIIDEATLKILNANEAAMKLYGYKKEEILNLSLTDLEVQSDSSVTLKINGTTKGIVRHKRADGSYIHLEIHSNSIVWHERAALLMLCIDISKRILLEEQLRHAKKMESIGTLAGGIAHDFNNILTAILGHATLLDIKLEEGSSLRKNVRDIIKSSERAANLVAQMLAFSRKQILNMQEHDINEVIEEFLPTLETLAGNGNIVETILSKMPLKVKADKNQLGQVLMNLTTNAKDAMPNGGKITIITNKVYVTQEMFPELKDGEYALIQFSDNGVGMSEDVAKRIFEPFFTTKEVGKGTGLGLSVIYGIIKQHKGEIQVNSVINKGTAFFIYLPLIG
ncbi:MAG: hypothetical protein OHK0040_09030 [bacterium]